MQEFLLNGFCGLNAQEFWASVIALCVVVLICLGHEVWIEQRSEDIESAWRWGDPYRRPKRTPIWARHSNCAFVAFVLASLAIGSAVL